MIFYSLPKKLKVIKKLDVPPSFRIPALAQLPYPAPSPSDSRAYLRRSFSLVLLPSLFTVCSEIAQNMFHLQNRGNSIAAYLWFLEKAMSSQTGCARCMKYRNAKFYLCFHITGIKWNPDGFFYKNLYTIGNSKK